MKMKSFNIPEELGSDISNIINTVKSNIGSLNYRIVPIDSIEFDPTNPRKLSISRSDIINGLQEHDSDYITKKHELDSLEQMAETIKKFGVRNAVEIYKYGTKYRLIHGERRCLSSIIAGKTDILAKVLDEKPNSYDIKLLQLIENVQREDLNLNETLNNIRLIIEEYKKNIDPNVTVDAAFLEQIVNKSRAQCFNILTVLNASDDIQICIRKGKIKNLEKAAVISREKDPIKRQEMLKACISGASLAELKKSKKESKEEQSSIKNNSWNTLRSKPGKKTSKINMGETQSKKVVEKLVTLVIKDPRYQKYSDALNKSVFNSYDSCSLAFKNLIRIMERVEVD